MELLVFDFLKCNCTLYHRDLGMFWCDRFRWHIGRHRSKDHGDGLYMAWSDDEE